MAKLLKKHSKKRGFPPGSLVFVGKKRTEKVVIDLIKYNSSSCVSHSDISIEEIDGFLDNDSICWINITGLHQTEIIGRMGEKFGIHPLLVEDILNTDQRAKMDASDDQLVFFMRMLQLDTKTQLVRSEQITLFTGKNYLLSFQEASGDVFDEIRNRLFNATTNIRTNGTDYLTFALMDSIVDNYIFAIEQLGTSVEKLVDDMLKRDDKNLLAQVNFYRREINRYRRIVRPTVEMIYQFQKTQSVLIARKTIPFLKDLADHIQHATEAIDAYKELLNEELTIFHMNMGHRLNEILRVLTIFSVVFIPLTFVAGVYGTNFDYIPELGYHYSYFIFWLALIVIAAVMLYYFKRKKWL